MHQYFEQMSQIAKEFGFESIIEPPKHEVDSPRHFIRTKRVMLGPIPILGGTKIAEVTSEAFSGSAIEENEDPANVALFYEGLKIHVLKCHYRPKLEQMLERLKQVLKEPGQID